MALPNLPAQETINQYVANGTDTAFNFNYYITEPADLVVYLLLTNGTAVLQVLNSDYTVTQAVDPTTGGTITFAIAPASGDIVTIYRNVQADYEFDFSNPITINGANMDAAYQKGILVGQQNQTNIALRCLKYPIAVAVPYNIPMNIDATTIPLLGLNQVWLGLSNGNVQAYTLTQNDGILRSQLADNQSGQDGALLVGLFLSSPSLSVPANTTVHTAVSALMAYMLILQSNSSGGDGATQIGFYNHNTATATNVAAALEGITQLQFAEKPVINSNLWVWQRGISFSQSGSSAEIKTADRWSIINGGSANYGSVSMQQIQLGSGAAQALDNFSNQSDYAAQFSFTSGGAGNSFDLVYTLHNANRFNGQQITLMWLLNNTGGTPITFQPQFSQYFGTGGSPSITVLQNLGSSFVVAPGVAVYYSTGLIPSVSGKTFGTNKDSTLKLFIETLTSFSNMQVGYVDVNIGLNPITYIGRDYATELNACQAFYETNYPQGTAPGAINPGGEFTYDINSALTVGVGGTDFVLFNLNLMPKKLGMFNIPFKTRKIITPSVTFYGPYTGTANEVDFGSNSLYATVDIASIENTSTTSTGIPITDSATSSVLSSSVNCFWVADTGL